MKNYNREIIVHVNNGFVAGRTGGVEKIFQLESSKYSGFRELLSNARKFDIGALLRPKAFVYLLFGTGIVLFQIHNTLSIINLAKQNERLREQIQMRYSVITAQELKVHELHSIHNITQAAASLGITASSVPAVELDP